MDIVLSQIVMMGYLSYDVVTVYDDIFYHIYLLNPILSLSYLNNDNLINSRNLISQFPYLNILKVGFMPMIL